MTTVPTLQRPRRHKPHRRASTYLVVLAIAMVVATLGLGGLLVAQRQAFEAQSLDDATEARFYAWSAIELGRLWIQKDPAWRTTYAASTTWAADRPIGAVAFTLQAFDGDGDLALWPYDSLILRATAVNSLQAIPGQIQARQIAEVRLVPDPKPLASLSRALHAEGGIRVAAGDRLDVGSAGVSSDTSLTNEGQIVGNYESPAVGGPGVYSGTRLTYTAKASPATGISNLSVAQAYASRATQLACGGTIDRQVLGPYYNPWGTPNSSSLYVVRASDNLTIRNSRIHGTLVVICPGKKLTLDAKVLLHGFRPDFPTLIVEGDLLLNFSSQNGPLREWELSKNFNPSTAPYIASDATDPEDCDSWNDDEYPSEIRGLVYVTGKIEVTQPCTIRGAVICESTAGRAVDCKHNLEIVYDPLLLGCPPQFFTSAVPMRPQAGSWCAVVD